MKHEFGHHVEEEAAVTTEPVEMVEDSCAECIQKQKLVDELRAAHLKEMSKMKEQLNENSSQQKEVDDLQALKAKHLKRHQLYEAEIHQMKEQMKAQEKQIEEKNHQLEEQRLQIKKLKNFEFEVENIVDHKRQNRLLLFKVHWKGFPTSEDTWEKRTNLECPEILNNYLKKHNLK